MPPRPSLRFTYTTPASVTPPERDILWGVYSRYFDAGRERFEGAVDVAGEVLRFFDRAGGQLVGMSLVSSFDEEHEGRRFRVVTTGAVCIEEQYRGLSAVQMAGLWWLAREKARAPHREMWWFFDTFSFKSYRLLPNNLQVYWPRPDAETPTWEAGVIDKLCRRQAGDAWDRDRGIVRAQGRRLRPGVAEVVDTLSAAPDVRFFLERNPRYADGERLPCLAPLSARNARSIVAATWEHTRRSRRTAPAAPSP